MPGREVLEPVFYLLPVTNELKIPGMSSPFLNLLTFKYKSPDLRTTASVKVEKEIEAKKFSRKFLTIFVEKHWLTTNFHFV